MRVDGAPAELPGYERRLRKRICHIGVGAFHRAHQAWYLHRLLQQGEGEGWGLCGIGLRAADRATLDALGEQDGLYSLWEIDEADGVSPSSARSWTSSMPAATAAPPSHGWPMPTRISSR